jgi:predicted dehydrogenase
VAEKLRIGVIGTSGYTSAIHLTPLSDHQDVDLAALCGRNRSRTQDLADKFQIPEAFTDYEEMIKRGKLDAVIVAAPDEMHYPMTMAALQAGLHVLCEKPMALNVNEAGEMLNAAQRANVKHMIEFSWRWMPHYQYLHKLVSDGFVGRGYHFHFRFLGDRGRTPDYTWRSDPKQSIGVLGDLGSHMIDLAIWMAGDATSVSGNLASFSERISPEGKPLTTTNESALLAVDFASGTQGMIHASTVAHTAARWREQYVSLHGEAGTLESEFRLRGVDQGVKLRGSRHDEKEFQILKVPDEFAQGADSGNPYDVMAKHLVGPKLFVDAILRDYMPDPSFVQGYKVQQVLDAAIESDATGRRVSLSK